MAEFLVTEAIDVDAANDNNNEGNIDTATVSEDEFIDDRPLNENNDFYPYFTNVSRSYDDAMQDSKMLMILKLVIILIVMKNKLKLMICLKQKLNYLKNLLLIHKV